MMWQPADLKNEWVQLIPLKADDFDELYLVASDPLIWEQHPTRERYKKEVFQTYFEGAMESGGAFMIRNTTNKAIGCSRFYGYDSVKREINIGYTFFSRECWGKPYNRSAKQLMLEYAFRFVDKVLFHVGANNIRSQKALEKIGAVSVGQTLIAYYGEKANENKIYRIETASYLLKYPR